MNQLNVNLPELPYAVSEAMNRLRINIKFCGKNTRKILLTSCQPNEGKSTISSYLWKMLAEAGFPTVLVDVDLRKSVMKTRFQMDYDDDTTMGLNHYLSGMAEYEDVVYSTNIPNGYMVPCTQLLENPSALLEDVRFKHGRQSVNMCTLTTLNVVIPHSIIRHRHPAIIRSCFWMIMQPKGDFLPLPSYIYQFIIKSLDFCLDN